MPQCNVSIAMIAQPEIESCKKVIDRMACVLTAGIRPKMTLPIAALRILITIKLANAPPNTVILGCRVAMIAAIRKVLSPMTS